MELKQMSLTPLLHEDEEVIQEFLPLGITVQFIQLAGEQAKMRAQPTGRHKIKEFSFLPG